jgi:uncharacterized membrane protein
VTDVGRRRLLFGGFALLVYVNLAAMLAPWLRLPTLFDPIALLTLLSLGFCLTHAAQMFGRRWAVLAFVLGALLTWAVEELGVRTGFPFGAYHYSDLLGPKLGHVPVLIPIAWFMMLYPSWIIARVLVIGPHGLERAESRATRLQVALVAALIMTGWDVVIDPGMSEAGYWTWHHPGPYFGVPLTNFGGWVLASALVFLIWSAGLPTQPQPTSAPAGLAVAAYALVGLRSVVDMQVAPPDQFVFRHVLAVVAALSMGLPALLAGLRLLPSPRP